MDREKRFKETFGSIVLAYNELRSDFNEFS